MDWPDRVSSALASRAGTTTGEGPVDSSIPFLTEPVMLDAAVLGSLSTAALEYRLELREYREEKEIRLPSRSTVRRWFLG